MRSLLGTACLIILFLSCGKDEVKIPDVSNIDGSFDLIRIEQIMMNADTNQVLQVLNEHPAFAGIYLNNVMGFNEDQEDNLKGFVTDKNINLMYQATQIQYGDFEDLEKEFEKE